MPACGEKAATGLGQYPPNSAITEARRWIYRPTNHVSRGAAGIPREILHLSFIIFPDPKSRSPALSLHTCSSRSVPGSWPSHRVQVPKAILVPSGCSFPPGPSARLGECQVSKRVQLEGVWNLRETANSLLGLGCTACRARSQGMTARKEEG